MTPYFELALAWLGAVSVFHWTVTRFIDDEAVIAIARAQGSSARARRLEGELELYKLAVSESMVQSFRDLTEVEYDNERRRSAEPLGRLVERADETMREVGASLKSGTESESRLRELLLEMRAISEYVTPTIDSATQARMAGIAERLAFETVSVPFCNILAEARTEVSEFVWNDVDAAYKKFCERVRRFQAARDAESQRRALREIGISLSELRATTLKNAEAIITDAILQEHLTSNDEHAR